MPGQTTFDLVSEAERRRCGIVWQYLPRCRPRHERFATVVGALQVMMHVGVMSGSAFEASRWQSLPSQVIATINASVANGAIDERRGRASTSYQ